MDVDEISPATAYERWTSEFAHKVCVSYPLIVCYNIAGDRGTIGYFVGLFPQSGTRSTYTFQSL